MGQAITNYSGYLDFTPSFLTQPVNLIDPSELTKSLENYDRNNLFQFLKLRFGKQRALELIDLFKIGTDDNLPDASVLWQINGKGGIQSGKIIRFDPMTGKQDPTFLAVQVHKVLKLPKFFPTPCLFGEHQLTNRPTATVAIVADEVTAIIATAFYPDYVWLASEGVQNLALIRSQALKNRSVVLFPNLSKDGSTFKWWSRAEKEFTKLLNCQVRVSRYLEDNASEDERVAGLDIADFLLREASLEGRESSKEENINQNQEGLDDSTLALSFLSQPLNTVTAS